MRFSVTQKKTVRTIACLLFCLFVCAMAFLNRTLVLEPVTGFFQGHGSFAEMKSTLQRNLLGDRLRGKDELLSLNGGYAGLQGRTRYNGVQKMTNGMLTATIEEMADTSRFADNLSRFCRFLEGKNIPFLFVLAPYKGPMAENLMPTGITDLTNKIADQAVAQLAEQKVPVLDLRNEMSQSKEQVERFFYRTDHHWNAEGAFYAFQRIMDAVRASFPGIQMTFTDPALWEKHFIPNWWLGSHGRRVGPLFSGVEDMDYFLPAFQTAMSRYSPGVWVCKGNFRQANIREWFLEQSNYMRMDSYFRYLGGGYPLTYHRNPQAENQMKILLIGDSFKHPTECFMSTEFTAMDVLDPREYGKMSEMDYVKLNPPDMVILLNYPGTVANNYFTDFGKETEPVSGGETDRYDIAVSADSGMDYALLPVRLESGRSYVLSLDQVQVLTGAPDGASIELYKGEDIVDLTVFDIEYGNQFEYHWGFQIPPGDEDGEPYQLRLYAGVSGGTEGMSLVYHGIRLQEFLLPNS